jgi:hypothetical protein
LRSWVELRSIRLRDLAAAVASATISARSAEMCLRRRSGVEGAGGTLRGGASLRAIGFSCRWSLPPPRG